MKKGDKDEKHEYESLLIRQLEKFLQIKDVSQREMSLSIGQSEGYVAKITSGHNLPKMRPFFWICDYFELHPRDFFDEKIVGNPAIINSILKDLYNLNNEQLIYVQALIKDLSKK